MTAEIRVKGAREHNLRDVSLRLPRGKLICFSGVSGSGKSSMAFDTIFAEGQRRYVESLSHYARQFMGQMPKPDVDLVSGLSPSISISQKSTGKNPRSTVGTITEIYDFLRVLFARVGTGNCPACGTRITAQTRDAIVAQVIELPSDATLWVLAPVVRRQKGEFRDLFSDLRKQGFSRARVDGETVRLAEPPSLDRSHRHDVEVVIDRIVSERRDWARVGEAVDLAVRLGEASVRVSVTEADAREAAPPKEDRLYSALHACGECGISFPRRRRSCSVSTARRGCARRATGSDSFIRSSPSGWSPTNRCRCAAVRFRCWGDGVTCRGIAGISIRVSRRLSTRCWRWNRGRC